MSGLQRLSELTGNADLDIRSKVKIVISYLEEQVIASDRPLDSYTATGLAAILRDVDQQLGANIEESERILSGMDKTEEERIA